MPTITDHAKKRMQERGGFNKKELAQVAKRAFKKGCAYDDITDESLKKYVGYVWSRKKDVNQIRVYGRNVYLFKCGVLITVFDIPPHIVDGKWIKKEKTKAQKQDDS